VNDKLQTPDELAAGTWLASTRVRRAQTLASTLRWALALPAVAVVFACADRRPMWPGVALALLGEYVQIWASAHLRKNVDVIMSGPYALARNPMYTGRFLVGLGLVLLTWRWFLIVPYVVGYALYAQARVLGEEAHLRSLFGKKYDDYCAATRRWFPWPPRQRFSNERWSWQCVLRNHQLRVTAVVVIGLVLIEWRISSLGRLPW
jgi:protein-S-isoprenylcysteine O-methyltransferase Ste14